MHVNVWYFITVSEARGHDVSHRHRSILNSTNNRKDIRGYLDRRRVIEFKTLMTKREVKTDVLGADTSALS